MRTLVLAMLAALSSAELVQLHQAAQIPQGWRETAQRIAPGAVFHNVMIGMRRSNTAAMRKVVDAASDPDNASYLQHLTYEQAGALVRPSAEKTAAVKRWLSQHGVTEVTEHPHGDYLQVEATAAQLEAMSGGKFVTYEHSTGMTVHRITGGVSVPAEVAAAVETFSGFHGFPLDPQPLKPKAKATPNAAGTVTPPFVRTTYNITKVQRSGKTNIQAIAQFQGQYVSNTDLASFCQQYDPQSGSCKITKYVGPDQPSEPGVESMLDTEYIVPLSQETPTWVYSYPNIDFCNDLLHFAANVTSENPHPSVISISYGSQFIGMCESALVQRFSQDVEKMASIGITVMISSGDDGSGHNTRQGVNQGKLNPSYPASVPYCIAVGATYFASGTSGPEEATTQFGSGGGFSYDFSAPSYQTSAINTYLNTVQLPTQLSYAQGGRGTPDVSALGESFTVMAGGQVMAVGGTSASSPSFAAMVTLLNEVCLSAGGKTLGFANPLFYKNPAAFRDVTLGTNAIQQPEGWAAIKGWDAATGLGTPDFPSLVKVVQQACSAARKQ